MLDTGIKYLSAWKKHLNNPTQRSSKEEVVSIYNTCSMLEMKSILNNKFRKQNKNTKGSQKINLCKLRYFINVDRIYLWLYAPPMISRFFKMIDIGFKRQLYMQCYRMEINSMLKILKDQD
jgi:hypothetical protein